MEIVGNTQLVAGDERTIESVLLLLRKTGLEPEGNPDVYVRRYKHFGVDEARDVRERAALRAAENRRVFIIATPVITTEAQNALLKTLEDAPGDALFFIIVPSPHALLGTIRSRAHILVFGDIASEISSAEAREFLASTPKERLELLKPMLEKGDDEARDMSAITAFLAALEIVLSEREVSRQGTETLAALYRARKYIGDKGALVKPLLEQLALLSPVLK